MSQKPNFRIVVDQATREELIEFIKKQASRLKKLDGRLGDLQEKYTEVNHEKQALLESLQRKLVNGAPGNNAELQDLCQRQGFHIKKLEERCLEVSEAYQKAHHEKEVLQDNERKLQSEIQELNLSREKNQTQVKSLEEENQKLSKDLEDHSNHIDNLSKKLKEKEELAVVLEKRVSTLKSKLSYYTSEEDASDDFWGFPSKKHTSLEKSQSNTSQQLQLTPPPQQLHSQAATASGSSEGIQQLQPTEVNLILQNLQQKIAYYETALYEKEVLVSEIRAEKDKKEEEVKALQQQMASSLAAAQQQIQQQQHHHQQVQSTLQLQLQQLQQHHQATNGEERDMQLRVIRKELESLTEGYELALKEKSSLLVTLKDYENKLRLLIDRNKVLIEQKNKLEMTMAKIPVLEQALASMEKEREKESELLRNDFYLHTQSANDRMEKEKEKWQRENDVLKHQVDSLEKDREKLRKEISAGQQELKQLTETLSKMCKEQELSDKTKSDLDERLLKYQEILHEKDQLLAVNQANVAQLKKELENFLQQKEFVEEKSAELEKERKLFDALLVEILSINPQLQTTYQGSVARMERERSALVIVRSAIQKMNNENQEKEQEKQQLKEKIEVLENQLH